MTADKSVHPYVYEIAQSAKADLRHRLTTARWPDGQTSPGWTQGVPTQDLRRLVDYWLTSYDWNGLEGRLNAHPQYRTSILGVDIHFLHIRSPHAGAIPLVLTHGWPGSVLEFLNVIAPLTVPELHGGSPDQAFHLVIPSLPGYGCSGRPSQPGWDVARTAAAWIELMDRLGYDRYVAQGGDWGAVVTAEMARIAPPGLLGMHTNLPAFILTPPKVDVPRDEEEREAVEALRRFDADLSAYYRLQASSPQTIGYALADSPLGQAAWIYEKLGKWSDSDHDPVRVFGMDAILDTISLYWYTETATSSARYYWENATLTPAQRLELPIGVSVFPREMVRAPRIWAEEYYPNLVHFGKLNRGGHFAAWEVPDLFVEEIRTTFDRVRAICGVAG
jgi:epoxide hydrolase